MTAGADHPAPARPLERNISALVERRRQEELAAGLPDRLASAIAAFVGTIWFALIHALIFGLWILLNLGVVGWVRPWDPSLVVLAMIASVEAIFLTTFVLMNQNRLARMGDRRAELTLQVSLLAEHETTKIAQLISAIAERLDVPASPSEELDDLISEVHPEAVLDEIDRHQED